MIPIHLERDRGVALAYAVLARLDLGRDAADLYDPSLPERPWVAPLLEAYRAAPGRLLLHGLPLQYGESLPDRLRSEPPSELGQELPRLFAAAMDDLADEPKWGPLPSDLLEVWDRLRAALWEKRGPAPIWTVFDAPALRWAGRAMQLEGGQRIAVALDRPPEHVLCQVFHETVHAVTDPVVLDGRPLRERSTRADDPGYALHQAVETAAVEVGEAIIEARAPEFADAYRRWRARSGTRGALFLAARD